LSGKGNLSIASQLKATYPLFQYSDCLVQVFPFRKSRPEK
jgi:hypothetical protein